MIEKVLLPIVAVAGFLVGSTLMTVQLELGLLFPSFMLIFIAVMVSKKDFAFLTACCISIFILFAFLGDALMFAYAHKEIYLDLLQKFWTTR